MKVLIPTEIQYPSEVKIPTKHQDYTGFLGRTCWAYVAVYMAEDMGDGFLGRTCWVYIPVCLAEDMGGSVQDFLGGPVGRTYLCT